MRTALRPSLRAYAHRSAISNTITRNALHEPERPRFPSGLLRRSAVAPEVVAVDDVRVSGVASPPEFGVWGVRSLREAQIDEIGLGIADANVSEAVVVDIADKRRGGAARGY